MIIVRLQGGLGNQLFQYATARRLALHHGTSLKLDVSWFDNIPPEATSRTYTLSHFNICQTFPTPLEISRYQRHSKRKIIRGFLRLVSKFTRRLEFFKESEFQIGVYNPDILKTSSNVYLVGYWQSEKYFKDIELVLRKELIIKDNPDDENLMMADLIRSECAVSLHIRRGDYIANSHTQELHRIVPLDYYYTAAENIASTVTNPHFFVFSDDPDWASKNLLLHHRTTFVVHNRATDYEDLRLMGLCKHHIIANSSFSWWGAWLSTNPDKIVYAPMRWLNRPEIDLGDLIPESWHKL